MAALPVIALTACSTEPDGVPVELSFSSQAPATAATTDITVTIGANTLVITKAQMVVRRIKLKPGVSTATCSDDDAGVDDCATIHTGPVLVDLPLTPNTITTLSANAPAGTYGQVDLRIHKPTDDNADAAFLAANPGFAGASIRVEGTYNGTAFVYTTDMTEKRELEFNPPVSINEDVPLINITVQANLESWFRSGTTLINPTTANKGGANENLVRNNIRASLRAFRDDDRNGR
jgi:hypothetical protein